jgi:hypothetical protein
MTVVIAESGDSAETAPDSFVLETLQNHGDRITALEAAITVTAAVVTEVATEVAEVGQAVDVAADTADTAVSIAIDAAVTAEDAAVEAETAVVIAEVAAEESAEVEAVEIAPESEPTPDDDEPPQSHTHPWFRPLRSPWGRR